MARNRWLVAALGLVTWLALGSVTRAQLGSGEFSPPSAGRALINDTRVDAPDDDDPFGGGEVAPADNPFAAPAKPGVKKATDKPTSDDNPFGDSSREQKPRRARKPSKSPKAAPRESNRGLRPSSNERVRDALASPTRMEFTEMPLQDAVVVS